jgi:hypothetical protein
MPRYIIADPAEGHGWTHIFSERTDAGKPQERERMTRFVYDTELGSLVHAEVDHVGMAAATSIELSDLEDSLKNANPEALESPEAWGLIGSDTLPDWCPQPAAARP